MEDRPTTFGSSHDRLARLWKVGDDTHSVQEESTQEHERIELLRDRLAEPLPLDPTAVRTLSAVLSHVLKQFAPFVGFSVGAMLLDPNTDPSVIWQIKDRYRERAESSPSELDRQVATVIYYAAIASALQFHKDNLFGEDRITTFSYKKLETHFSQLLENSWLTPELVKLFKKATAMCSE
ncbi:MAG: hypothetical protein ACYSUY_03105 [Planctomycetota bacterium]|jgi:hypothetical protein